LYFGGDAHLALCVNKIFEKLFEIIFENLLLFLLLIGIMKVSKKGTDK